jgi:hypothetical protein
MNFQDAALTMLRDRSWLCIPQGLDAKGYPKRALVKDYYHLERTEEVVRAMPWQDAQGLGIVLGQPSNNLGVLDIDDQEVFDVVVAALGISRAPRLVRSIRNRGHWYVNTIGWSQSSERTVLWDGRPVTVELRASLRQIAAPPTPGYQLLNPNPPQVFHDMAEAFEFFCDVLRDFAPKRFEFTQGEEQQAGAGYPHPWAEEVPEGSRNQSAYIEAHKLREAGMPLQQALATMSARFSVAYSGGGMEWREIEATVRSAYRKAVPGGEQHYGGVRP